MGRKSHDKPRQTWASGRPLLAWAGALSEVQDIHCWLWHLLHVTAAGVKCRRRPCTCMERYSGGSCHETDYDMCTALCRVPLPAEMLFVLLMFCAYKIKLYCNTMSLVKSTFAAVSAAELSVLCSLLPGLPHHPVLAPRLSCYTRLQSVRGLAEEHAHLDSGGTCTGGKS